MKAGEGSFWGISLRGLDFKIEFDFKKLGDAAVPHGVGTVHGNGVSGDWMSGKRDKSLEAPLCIFGYLNTFNHLSYANLVSLNIRQMVDNFILVSVRSHRKSDFRLCIF